MFVHLTSSWRTSIEKDWYIPQNIKKYTLNYPTAHYPLMSSLSSPCKKAMDHLEHYWQASEVGYPSTFMRTRDRERFKLLAKRHSTQMPCTTKHWLFVFVKHTGYLRLELSLKWQHWMDLWRHCCAVITYQMLWSKEQFSIPFPFELITRCVS